MSKLQITHIDDAGNQRNVCLTRIEDPQPAQLSGPIFDIAPAQLRADLEDMRGIEKWLDDNGGDVRAALLNLFGSLMNRKRNPAS